MTWFGKHREDNDRIIPKHIVSDISESAKQIQLEKLKEFSKEQLKVLNGSLKGYSDGYESELPPN